jgi:hypothetical protein
MKSFKDYLTESKQVYEFKVKIAGDCPKDCQSQIKTALAQFDIASVSAGKSTPITAQPHEFPEHKNVGITIFDVTTNYPATSKQVHDKIAHVLGLALNDIRVRNEKEEAEVEINHQHDKTTGHAVIGTDYAPADHQDKVGEKHTYQLLQDLAKNKHGLEQRTGINDQLLAKSAPKFNSKDVTPALKTNKTVSVVSPLGSKHTKLSPLVPSGKNSLNVPAKGK